MITEAEEENRHNMVLSIFTFHILLLSYFSYIPPNQISSFSLLLRFCLLFCFWYHLWILVSFSFCIFRAIKEIQECENMSGLLNEWPKCMDFFLSVNIACNEYIIICKDYQWFIGSFSVIITIPLDFFCI